MNTFVNMDIDDKLYEEAVPEKPELASSESGGIQAVPEMKDCTGRMKEIYADVSYVLENKRVYLDATLNLSKLSRMLHINTTYLSKVANLCFGCNLKTLLNKYRIAYAKELLKDEACDIRQLPARCGFLSRSTFYAAFAKFEHTTPKEYQSRYLSRKLREAEAVEPAGMAVEVVAV